MLQCDATCCRVLQCIAVCYNVLQYVAVCVAVSPAHFGELSVLQYVAECCSMLQCAAVCCSVLQRVAVCCSELQCHLLISASPLRTDGQDKRAAAVRYETRARLEAIRAKSTLRPSAVTNSSKSFRVCPWGSTCM